MQEKLSCIILACGAGRRFGGNKLLAPFRNKPLIMHTLESIPEENFSEILVVTRYKEVSDLINEMSNKKYRVIISDNPEADIGYTIRLGIENINPKSIGCMFSVADQPLKEKKSLKKMIDLFLIHNSAIIALSYKKKRGNPVIFPKKYYDDLAQLLDNQSGADVIKLHKECLLLSEAGSYNELEDIDSVEDLAKLEKII